MSVAKLSLGMIAVLVVVFGRSPRCFGWTEKVGMFSLEEEIKPPDQAFPPPRDNIHRNRILSPSTWDLLLLSGFRKLARETA